MHLHPHEQRRRMCGYAGRSHNSLSSARGVVKPWLRYPLLRRGPVGRYVEQAVNASAFLRPLRLGLVADGIDVLCVQEYWTARFDVIVRSLDHPVLVVDQGLPDRREIKMLSVGRSVGALARSSRPRTKQRRWPLRRSGGAHSERCRYWILLPSAIPGGESSSDGVVCRAAA